jgi:hypothetical protein
LDKEQKHRWLRFSLGTMLLLIALVAALLWGLGERRQRVEFEARIRKERVESQRIRLLQYPPQIDEVE